MGILSALFGKKKEEDTAAQETEGGGIKPANEDVITADQDRARDQMERELAEQRSERDAGESVENKPSE